MVIPPTPSTALSLGLYATITVPLAVIASCEKLIKTSCPHLVGLASAFRSVSLGQASVLPPKEEMGSITAVVLGLKTESLSSQLMWDLELGMPNLPALPRTVKSSHLVNCPLGIGFLCRIVLAPFAPVFCHPSCR